MGIVELRTYFKVQQYNFSCWNERVACYTALVLLEIGIVQLNQILNAVTSHL